MTFERTQYITSQEYRDTLKIGDTLVWIREGVLIIGKIVRITEMWIVIDWKPHRGDYDLNRTGGVITAARLEDLLPEECAEIMTLRIKQCAGT